MSAHLQISIEDGVARLTLARPEKLNALDEALIDDIAAACRRIERDPGVRAVIITGSGTKAFSAGGDITAWSALEPVEFGRRWLRDGHLAFDALTRLRQPLIAVLNGHALGGGLELAACADVRVVESHVKIGLPETGLGVIPGWSGTQRAVRRFGSGVLRRMALFGDILTAEDAFREGIADYLVPSGEGAAKAMELAGKVTSRALVATELCKMLINAAEDEERERSIEAIAGIAAAQTADLREGVAAYREKRAPKFSGR